MQHIPARRQFMKVAAAAVATSRFPILGANDRINLGIVGLGGRGNGHIRYYSTLDQDCRMAGLCDVNQAARERARRDCQEDERERAKEYADMRAMFDAKDIDAVSIATPNHWHALATIMGLSGGQGRIRREAGQPQCLRRQPDGQGRAQVQQDGAGRIAEPQPCRTR